MILIFSIFSFILGSALASFASVVIYRVPNHQSIIKPNSYCISCMKEIKWYDNIPILSYIILRGKCRSCKAKIGLFSFFLELIGGISFLLIFLKFGFHIETIIYMLITFILLIIFGIDYTTYEIYDFSLIIFGILSLVLIIYESIINKAFPTENIIGLLAGGMSFFLIRVIGKLIYKQEALGMGDVLLMAIAGFMLGWKNLLLAILIGSLLGSIISLFLIAIKVKNKESQIAFGPYLVTGIFIAMVYGQDIIHFYLGLVM